MRIPLVAALGATAIALSGAANAAEIRWVKSFDAALSRAKASHKLVMLDFYTDW